MKNWHSGSYVVEHFWGLPLVKPHSSIPLDTHEWQAVNPDNTWEILSHPTVRVGPFYHRQVLGHQLSNRGHPQFQTPQQDHISPGWRSCIAGIGHVLSAVGVGPDLLAAGVRHELLDGVCHSDLLGLVSTFLRTDFLSFPFLFLLKLLVMPM